MVLLADEFFGGFLMWNANIFLMIDNEEFSPKILSTSLNNLDFLWLNSF